MDDQQLQQYQRIQAFNIDLPTTRLGFSQRLARENRWSLPFARRVVEEYKKFAFLAVAAGHPVTPSDQVDQAWHLHLSYSRSYWEAFCPKALGQPLHHEPTQGGPAEQGKFHEWYAKTLASYRRLFGHEPPADIWPEPTRRFGRDLHHVRVNTRQYWLLPKPALPLPDREWGWVAVLPLLLAVASGADAAAPLAGEPIVPNMLAGLFLATLALALALRSLMSRPYGTGKPLDLPLPPEELAYLAGGHKRAIDTALVSLARQGCIGLDEDGRNFHIMHARAQPSELETKILKHLFSHGSTPADALRTALKADADALRIPLEVRGLWVAPSVSEKARILAGLLFLPLFVLALVETARLSYAAHSATEASHMLLLTLLGLCGGTGFSCWTLGRSHYGNQVLSHAEFRAVRADSDEGLLRAMAVFGPQALAGTALAGVMAALLPPTYDSGCNGCGCGGG
jgi:uncharacterized protein (TIGR04222 family)